MSRSARRTSARRTRSPRRADHGTPREGASGRRALGLADLPAPGAFNGSIRASSTRTTGTSTPSSIVLRRASRATAEAHHQPASAAAEVLHRQRRPPRFPSRASIRQRRSSASATPMNSPRPSRVTSGESSRASGTDASFPTLSARKRYRERVRDRSGGMPLRDSGRRHVSPGEVAISSSSMTRSSPKRPSDKARVSTNEWYRSTLLSRLDDKQKSVLIVVMQRLHMNDLTGFVEAIWWLPQTSPFPRSRLATNASTSAILKPTFDAENEPLHAGS